MKQNQCHVTMESRGLGVPKFDIGLRVEQVRESSSLEDGSFLVQGEQRTLSRLVTASVANILRINGVANLESCVEPATRR